MAYRIVVDILSKVDAIRFAADFSTLTEPQKAHWSHSAFLVDNPGTYLHLQEPTLRQDRPLFKSWNKQVGKVVRARERLLQLYLQVRFFSSSRPSPRLSRNQVRCHGTPRSGVESRRAGNQTSRLYLPCSDGTPHQTRWSPSNGPAQLSPSPHSLATERRTCPGMYRGSHRWARSRPVRQRLP
jgi:hypothetical protein